MRQACWVPLEHRFERGGTHLGKVVQTAAVVVDQIVGLEQVALVADLAKAARAVLEQVDAAHLQMCRVPHPCSSLPVHASGRKQQRMDAATGIRCRMVVHVR